MTRYKLVVYVPVLVLSIAVLHFLAVFIGLYNLQIQQGFVWIDNVLHTLFGAVFALLGLWIVENKGWSSSTIFTVSSVLGFTFVLAVGWEIVEYLFFVTFSDYAQSLKIYSPTPQEAFSDIVSNLVGGVILLLLVYQKNKLVQ